MKAAHKIVRFLLDAAARGERTALVTITDVIGASSRAPGSHMGISETGAFIGAFSGGCVEAAVVGEALRSIETDEAELIRFGAGGRFIDIRLPCGGALDLLITPCPATDVMQATADRLDAREPVTLALSRTGSVALERNAHAPTGWSGDTFMVSHEPDLRLIVVGHGAETLALAGLAAAYGVSVSVFTPEASIVTSLTEGGIDATLLKTPADTPDMAIDAATAVVMLFHDHDWETAQLTRLLGSEAFFIGAMGSRVTHARRLEALRDAGVSSRLRDTLIGPIGFIPAVRDPDTLALSVLGQVVERFQERRASVVAGAGPFAASAQDLVR